MTINSTFPKIAEQKLSIQDWLDAQGNAFLVKPFTAQGVGGFVFKIKTNDRIELRADITDYVMETNEDHQDHIALKPLVITTGGYIGELYHDEKSFNPTGTLGVLQKKLTAVQAFLPIYSNAVNLTRPSEIIDGINSTINKAQNLVSMVTDATYGGTQQEQAYSKIYGMWKARQIVTIETPWAYLDSMVIQNVSMEQDEKTKMITDISITLKQLSFVTKVTGTRLADGRVEYQLAPTRNRGLIRGNEILDVVTAPWASSTASVQNLFNSILVGPTAASALSGGGIV